MPLTCQVSHAGHPVGLGESARCLIDDCHNAKARILCEDLPGTVDRRVVRDNDMIDAMGEGKFDIVAYDVDLITPVS